MSLFDVNPIDYPQAWDVIEVSGGIESPGICVVSGFKRSNEWDIKKGKGTVGASMTYSQKPPAKGKVKFMLWTRDHFRQWDEFLPLLKYDPTKKNVQAIDIWHPALDAININSVVTESVGQVEKEDKGMYSIEVEFIEYFPVPKKSAASSPSGSSSDSKSKSTPGATPDPVGDAQQAEIASLLSRAAQP